MSGNTPNPFISIVAPCYNESEVLEMFFERVKGICERLNLPHEIILVDDGSTDGTWNIIQGLALRDPTIRGFRLSRNHGHQLALSAGLVQCRGKRILIIDADLQDPPELLPEMMKLMDDGADVVYGQRMTRKGESLFKRFTAALFYRLLNILSDTNIPRDTGDFRLINDRVLEVFNRMPEYHRFIRGMISWIGFRQAPLFYNREERAAGRSKYPFRKMLTFSLNAITSFSMKPLRIASYAGLFTGLASLLMIIYIVIGNMLGHTIQGWASLAVIILFLGSMQLCVLGIIGEYLGRLFLEGKNRPLFIIEQTVSQSSSNDAGSTVPPRQIGVA